MNDEFLSKALNIADFLLRFCGLLLIGLLLMNILSGCATIDHDGWARRVDYFHTLPESYPGK